MEDWGKTFLRIGLGVIFVAHGLQHAFGMFGGSGIEGFSKILSGLGFSPALFWANLAAYAELLCGLCLVIGFMTRIACVPLLIFIVVAAVKVHLTKGFFIIEGGLEYNFLIACACISLIITGGGKLSVTK